MAAERKSRTNLMARACGAKEAFVEKELFCNKPAETRQRMHPGLESSKALPAVLASSERHVRLEGTCLGDESASLR